MENINGDFNIKHLFSYINFLCNKQMNWIADLRKYHELKGIINNRAIKTYFQPIVHLQSGHIAAYEALNRPPISKWFPSTEQFYDFIGRTNQVFLVEMVCRNSSIRHFSKNIHQLQGDKEKLLFINIHPDVLVDQHYKPGETMQLLSDFGIKPSQVVFELTEKKAVNDFQMFERVIYNYRSQGFRLAIDDAGSGYNSLKTLVHLRPEFIKLDRSLIHNITNNEAQKQMVSLLLNFANQSKTCVIAEGIELMEDLYFLKKAGVHYGQGYALGKPEDSLLKFENKNQLSPAQGSESQVSPTI